MGDFVSVSTPSLAHLPIGFDNSGLVPAILQEVGTDRVLMLGFMNRDALAATLDTGKVHFWSRSRQKLWLKGETSGHFAHLHEIRINCEQNSLLLLVHQDGAICHEGYPTCYYRRLERDGQLTVIADRQFDPAAVYGATPSPPTLTDLTRQQFAAYEYLRDHDLTAESGTSRRLRTGPDVSPRVADELRELAGVLDGSHVHRSKEADARLEGGQVIYWLTLAAIQAGLTWDAVRSDQALRALGDVAQLGDDAIVHLLRAAAAEWASGLPAAQRLPAIRAALGLVGAALRAMGTAVDAVVAADLDDLRGRPYLASFFAAS